MMRKFFFLAALFAAFLPMKASASWQYTKWGMSVAQVVAASKGVATQTSSDVADKQSPTDHSQMAKLSAPYSSGAFQFTAYFLFDRGGKLSCVNLVLASGDPDMLIGALRTKYGKPESEDKSSVTDSFVWYAGGDMVSILKIGDGAGSLTTVGYQPRMTANNSGL